MPSDFSIDYLMSNRKSPSSDAEEVGETSATEIAEKAPTKSNELTSIRMHLESRELWKKFDELGTEMIVTKSGRRMFPTLQVSLKGLHPNHLYSVMVDLECVDRKRYRYSFHQSRWTATGPGEEELPSRTFLHPDSPSLGSHWMRGVISFDKVKITNNQLDNNGYMIVNSMHRYRPRVHVIRMTPTTPATPGAPPFLTQAALSLIPTALASCSFSFPETAFIAVTAYQNHRITALKIESNPFAKGFREIELEEPMTNFSFLFPFYACKVDQ